MSQEIYQVCGTCGGSGKTDKKDCRKCDGEGKVLFGYLEPEKKESKKDK